MTSGKTIRVDLGQADVGEDSIIGNSVCVSPSSLGTLGLVLGMSKDLILGRQCTQH